MAAKLQQCTFLFLFSLALPAFGQQRKQGEVLFPDSIVFRDRLNGWAADSINHNLGIIPPVNLELVKYFKYTGNDTVRILRSWGDPHFIPYYPKEPLVKEKIYSFTASFYFEGREGSFRKIMGFDLSNGQRIAYEFKGDIQRKH